MSKTAFTFMLDDNLKKKIKAHIKETGKTSVTSVIIEAINEYLKS